MTAWLVLLTASMSLGAVLVGTSVPGVRRVSLRERVEPYVGPPGGTTQSGLAPPSVDAWSSLALLTGPVAHDAVRLLDRMLGGSASVRTRLDRLGTDLTPERFRLEQLGWGAAGLAIAALMGGGRVVGGDLSGVLPLVVLSTIGFLTGILARDRWLTRSVTRRMQQLDAEFPTVVELLALSVGAGEGMLAALERISRVGHGAFVGELNRVLGSVRSGTATTDAFRQLDVRIDTPEVSRFVDAVVIAMERGTPLVDVLNAQVLDAREAGRRSLIESGGRKEIAMMIPVVFLVLPLSVVFALFPGFYGLSLGST